MAGQTLGFYMVSLAMMIQKAKVLADEVVLLDSNNTALGNWTSYQYDTDPEDIHRTALYSWEKQQDLVYNKLTQYFFVCSFRQTANGDQNNWLRSPSYDIGDLAVLKVTIDYDVSLCEKSKYPNCKERVFIYYQFTNDGDNPINENNSMLLGHLPLDKSMLDRRGTVTLKINVTAPRKRKMVIAFRDTGGCTHVYKVIVRSAYCPSVIRNLAMFPRTVVRNNHVDVEGSCNANASPQSSDEPKMTCHLNGKWGTPVGSCNCVAGYWLNSSVCEACRKGTYKILTGNFACRPCPRNSHSDHDASTNCTCLEKYSRLTDDVAERCSAPPGPPQHVKIEQDQSNLITVSWQHPKDDGGRNDLGYKVFVRLRNRSLIIAENTSSTTFSFRHLEPGTYYEITVTSFSGAGDGQSILLNATTLTYLVTTEMQVNLTGKIWPTRPRNKLSYDKVLVIVGVLIATVASISILALVVRYKKKNAKKSHRSDVLEPNEESNKFIEIGL